MNTRLKHVQDWPAMAEEAKWSAFEMAKLCGVSKDTLRRYFHRHIGRSVQDWLASQKQQKAKELLAEGYSVKETALSLGYKQQTNFTRKFKTVWGVCPSQYQSVNPVTPQVK